MFGSRPCRHWNQPSANIAVFVPAGPRPDRSPANSGRRSRSGSRHTAPAATEPRSRSTARRGLRTNEPQAYDRSVTLRDQFFDAAERHLAALRRDAGPEIDAAAALTAERIAAGGRLHHFDTGHTAREPVRRAGGLVGLHSIEARWDLAVSAPPAKGAPPASELETSYFYDNEEMGRMVAERARLATGDVLWLVSNSGKEPFPVALALGARSRGCAVVAVTCVAFSRSVAARHSSGRRLYEVADRVVDTRGPLGDAAVDAPGLPTAIAPL